MKQFGKKIQFPLFYANLYTNHFIPIHTYLAFLPWNILNEMQMFTNNNSNNVVAW